MLTLQKARGMDALAVLLQYVDTHDGEDNVDALAYMQGVDSTKDTDFARAFEDAGFYFIDTGCFTAVFGCKSTPDWVYKVSMGNRDGMLELHTLLTQLDHVHLPRIDSVYREGCHGVAVSERLVPQFDFPGETLYVGMDYTSSEHRYNKPEFLVPALDLLAKHGVDHSDLHDGNIMRRPHNGCPVITDPTTDGANAT